VLGDDTVGELLKGEETITIDIAVLEHGGGVAGGVLVEEGGLNLGLDGVTGLTLRGLSDHPLGKLVNVESVLLLGNFAITILIHVGEKFGEEGVPFLGGLHGAEASEFGEEFVAHRFRFNYILH